MPLLSAPVRVCANHVESVAWLVVPAYRKGNQRGQVSREEVAAARAQLPLRALRELLEARRQQPTAALLCTERTSGMVTRDEQREEQVNSDSDTLRHYQM